MTPRERLFARLDAFALLVQPYAPDLYDAARSAPFLGGATMEELRRALRRLFLRAVRQP